MNNNYPLTEKNQATDDNFNYIVFQLNEKLYAIDIQNVIEVINLTEIQIPQKTPKGVMGITNYKGMMISVLDLCPLLGFETKKFNINNELIIACIDGNCFAIAAVKIVNIFQFEKNQLQTIPYNVENSIISEIIEYNENTIGILNINNIETVISNNVFQENTIDYSQLLPDDEKSLQILALRSKTNEKNQDLFSFPVNTNNINQFILFNLENQNYYLDLKYIKEFITAKRVNITKLPYTKDYIKGIINLRGEIIILLDLKRFLNNEPSKITETGKIIITEGKNYSLALLVDDVKEIRNLKNIPFGKVNSEYISNEFCENGILYNILNFEKIINDEKIYIIQ